MLPIPAAVRSYSILQQVSTSLLGVVPEEFCRDAPPAAVAATEAGRRGKDGGPDSPAVGRERSPPTAAIAKGNKTRTPAASAGGGDSTSSRSPRVRQRLQQQQQRSPSPKCQRGQSTAVSSAGDEEGVRRRSREERSRRRLAAFLEGQAALTGAPAPVPDTAVSQGVDASAASPGLSAVGGASDGGGVCDVNTRCGASTKNLTREEVDFVPNH